jgi:DNA-binding PadR family transcriptional regulator
MEFLKALGRCRVMNQSLATQTGVSEEEIESFVERKVISREEVEDVHYYTLTEKGEKVLKEEVPSFGEIYRGFILEHDVCLMEFYLKRTEQEKESWLTRDDLIKKHRLPGTVDGAFINEEGQLEAVEVISKTAKPSVVEKTEAFLKEVNIEKMNYLLY